MRFVHMAVTFVYEWKGRYIVTEWGYQNGYTNDTLGDRKWAGEEIGVGASFCAAGSSPEALGGEVLRALSVFGTKPAKYSAWETQERNRDFAKAVGARGRASFSRDCRRANVVFDEDSTLGKISVYPWDNCHRELWISPMEELVRVLPAKADALAVGEAVLSALTQATWHADRKY